METKPVTKPKGPIIIRVGSVRVPVYAVPCKSKKAWEVRDHLGGRGHTQRRKFSQRKRALAYAEERAIQMANAASAKYRLEEKQAWELELVQPKLQAMGQTLTQVVEKAFSDWELSQQLKLGESPMVSEVVTQFVAEIRRRGLSDYHLRDYTIRLNRFGGDFRLPINRTARAELEAWLNGLTSHRGKNKTPAPLSPRTWNNYRDALAALFKFAKERKYLPADWAELDGLVRVKLKRRRIRIWSPENMSALLSASSERLLPGLLISAFAGLRSDEVQRLRWEDIKWDKGYIFMRQEITKTERERTVPILDNLAEWLKPWSEATGRVCTYVNLSVGKSNLARRIGLKWSRNILRDSFISYRLAETKNLAQVALEAGNSPGVIQRSYLELTTPAEAAKWFSIRPRSIEQNVLPLKFR